MPLSHVANIGAVRKSNLSDFYLLKITKNSENKKRQKTRFYKKTFVNVYYIYGTHYPCPWAVSTGRMTTGRGHG